MTDTERKKGEGEREREREREREKVEKESGEGLYIKINRFQGYCSFQSRYNWDIGRSHGFHHHYIAVKSSLKSFQKDSILYWIISNTKL